MSNHYPSRNRYVPSRYLPTHYYRKHHEFGIPFKRYPLNYDEHEESGYYIDFNQTHLVYAVPCTDITFSKKYNRDDLKNETCDTTAETRETVGTTAARYHDNTHSRHYPHCAHSSHVQGFDVLTITKLMSYDMELYDVTPERLKTLFENFACPQRDTVVFEHVWIEQHKFLSMYFKVHKKPLLDYCLFRFPEPPVCPGPVPPTPGERPEVESVVPMGLYIDPVTCVTYLDLLVTFTQPIIPTVSDYKTIYSSENGDHTDADILNATITDAPSTTMIVTSTFEDIYTNMYLTVDLTKVQNEEGLTGIGSSTHEVVLELPYDEVLSCDYEDHEFDSVEGTTTVWLAYCIVEQESPIIQTPVPVTFAVNNMDYIKGHCMINKTQQGEGDSYMPTSVTLVQHDGRECVQFVFNQDFSDDPTYDISFQAGAYLFKYVDQVTGKTYLNTTEENFVLQWSSLERVISNYGLMSNSEQQVTGLWVIYPCESTDIVSVDLSKITRAPYDDLENTVNPIAYNLGDYIPAGELVPQAGREVFLTFSPNVTFSDRYTYTINSEAITDDSGHYNAYWIHAIPDPEPQPDHGPMLINVWGDYDPAQANPAKIECVFDQDVEIVNTSGIKVVYASEFGEVITTVFSDMSLSEFNTFITDVVTYVQNDIQVVPEGGTPDPNYNYVDYYMDYEDQAQDTLRHQDSGKVYKDNQTIENYLPYINYTDDKQLSFTNQQVFGASSPNYYSQMYGLVDWMTESCAAINKLFEDLADRNSITVAEMFDGTHATTVGELRWLAEYTIPHYSYWLDLVKAGTETDAQYQAHINALYNEPLGGQTYPDDAILATRSIIDGASAELGISVSDLLTDPNNAIDLERITDKAGRALVFIWMLTSACTDTYKLATLNDIYDGTYTHTNVGSTITYYPLTNWITVDRLTFSTDLTNLVIEFNEPAVRTRSVYVEVPNNALRNPSTGYVNRDGVDYAYFNTPEIIFFNSWGEYNSNTNTTTIGLNFNNGVDFIGNLSDITITDGIHTAHPTSIVPMYPDNYYSYYVIFDNSAGTSWAGNQTIDLDVAQGVFENKEDPTYTNDAYTAQFYVYSDQPPVPPVVTHTVTYDAQGGTPTPATETVNDGAMATQPQSPTKTNYSFNYWTLNGVQYDFNDPVYSDITLVADWTYVGPAPTAPQLVSISSTNNVGQDYTLTLVWDQDVISTDDPDLNYFNVHVTDGVNNTDPDGVQMLDTRTVQYTFYTPYPDWLANTPVTVSIDQAAVWDSTQTVYNAAETLPNLVFGQAYPYPPVTYYTVTFDSDGGSAVASQSVASGSTATQPANPTKTNYTFNYWKLNGSQYNFSTPVTGNITLVADWTYVPTPTPVAPTDQYPKKNGNNVSPIYVHNFGNNNSHLSLYLKYDTKVDGGHSYIKFKDSSFKCEGNSAFFGWTIQTVRVKVGSTTVKELSNVYHSTSDTNWSEDFNTNWVDLGAVQTGTGAATLNVYAKSNAVSPYTGFEFNEDYNCTIAHNELV